MRVASVYRRSAYTPNLTRRNPASDPRQCDERAPFTDERATTVPVALKPLIRVRSVVSMRHRSAERPEVPERPA